MKYFYLILLLLFSCVTLLDITGVSAGGGYYSHNRDVDDQREYWKQGHIDGINFEYQFGFGGYINHDNKKLELRFDQPFTGKIGYFVDNKKVISNEFDNSSGGFDLENITDIVLDLSVLDHYKYYNIILESDLSKVKLDFLGTLDPNGYIYSDELGNNIFGSFLLTRDVKHIADLQGRNIILDKKILPKEYKDIVGVILQNQVIINEEKNAEFLSYIYGKDYINHRIQRNAHIRLMDTFDTNGLSIKEHADEYDLHAGRVNKFVEIPYFIYEKSQLRVGVLLENLDFYKKKGIETSQLLFIPQRNYNKIKPDDGLYDRQHQNYFDWRSIYFTDEIKEKYADGWLLSFVLILYLGSILGCYFLYHKRFKRRVTVIYFSLGSALVFFVIYLVWFRILVGGQNITYNTSIYHTFDDFMIEENHKFDFAVKKSSYQYDTQDSFGAMLDGDKNYYIYPNRYHRNNYKTIQEHKSNNQVYDIDIHPLRYIYFKYYKFHEKEIFDEMIEVDESNLKDENIPTVVKYALRNIDGKVKYKINTIQNKDQKTIHYIITVEY